MNMLDLKCEIISHDYFDDAQNRYGYVGIIPFESKYELQQMKAQILQPRFTQYMDRIEFVYLFEEKELVTTDKYTKDKDGKIHCEKIVEFKHRRPQYYIKCFPKDLDSVIDLFNSSLRKYLFNNYGKPRI